MGATLCFSRGAQVRYLPALMGKTNKTREIAASLCDGCAAECCRYVATQIDKPTCRRDYDHIRWYLMHRDVYVFVDHDGDWYLEFATACENLGADHRCLRYEERPRICRRHGEDDTDCEFHGEDPPYKRRFATAREFEAWLDKRGRKWRWKKKGD